MVVGWRYQSGALPSQHRLRQIPTFLSCGDNRIMPKEWYESAIKMKFENRELNVPKGYDSVLSKWYGDYMILPSEESRNKQLATKRYMITNFEMYK